MTTGTLGYWARRIDQAREALHARHAQVEQDEVEVVVLVERVGVRGVERAGLGDGGVGDAAGNRLLQRLAEQRDGHRRSVCGLPPWLRPSLPCLNLCASLSGRSSSAVLAVAMRLKRFRQEGAAHPGHIGRLPVRLRGRTTMSKKAMALAGFSATFSRKESQKRGSSAHARFLRLGIAHLAQHGGGNREAEARVGIAFRPALQTVVDRGGKGGQGPASSARSR